MTYSSFDTEHSVFNKLVLMELAKQDVLLDLEQVVQDDSEDEGVDEDEMLLDQGFLLDGDIRDFTDGEEGYEFWEEW